MRRRGGSGGLDARYDVEGFSVAGDLEVAGEVCRVG